jgi:hypothetical protein
MQNRHFQILFATISFCVPILHGQVAQERPELCGNGDFVAVPSDLIAIEDALFLTPTNQKSQVKFEFLGKVVQVCNLSSEKYLVVIEASQGGSIEFLIINRKTGELLDRFRTFTPSVSPDQHWLVYRAYFAHPVDPPSDEYLLYDLTKDAAANIVPNGGKEPHFTGRVVYPVVKDSKPFHNIGLPEKLRHGCQSAFYWSSDSTALAFSDRTYDKGSLILVVLDGNSFRSLMHPIALSENPLVEIVVDARAQLVSAHFVDRKTESKIVVSTRWGDFVPAVMEVHPAIVPLEVIMIPASSKPR